MKKILCLLLCAVMALSLFSGCGGEDSPYVPTGNGLTWDDPTAPVATAPNQEQPAQELTLVYYPEESFNPLSSTDYTNLALGSLIYQGLFTVDRDYNVEPMLCKNYTVSQDMRTYTFYIREASFSDGTPLTVSDVVATLQAARESDVYSGRFSRVTDIFASSDGGVTVTLNTAYENFPILLDVPILKASQLEDPRPLGTGPYYLDASLGTLRLCRRANWWCDAELAVTASVINLLEGQDPTQIRDEFQFGELDLVCADPGSDRYADYRSDYELWDCENGIFLYLGCNVDKGLFSNPQVRAALTYAIDRDAIVDEFYRGYARSATLAASPLSPYYDAGLAAKYEYDTAKFLEVLTETGMTGQTVKILVNQEDSMRLRVARKIQQMLEACGLKVTLELWSGDEYQYKLAIKDYDLYIGQTKLSPNMDLSAFFASGGRLSQGGMSNSGIYAMCVEALANQGNYYNVLQMVAEDGRLCPILFRSYAVYATRGVISDLTPSRDNVFYYSLGETMEDALLDRAPQTDIPAKTE